MGLESPPAPVGRLAELLALAGRLNVTKAIKSFQERGLTAEETAETLSLKSASALDMIKAVRGEAIGEETKRAPVPEPKPPRGGPAASQARVNEERLTSEVSAVHPGIAQKNARIVKIQEGRRNKMNLVLKFEHEKETPGTHRFKEIVEEGKTAAVGTLYIRKEALPTPVPATIEVTIKS